MTTENLGNIPFGGMAERIKARARVAAGPMEVHALLGEVRAFLGNLSNLSPSGSARAWELCEVIDATLPTLGDAYALGTKAAHVRQALRLSLRELLTYALHANRYLETDSNTRGMVRRAYEAIDLAKEQVREVRRGE